MGHTYVHVDESANSGRTFFSGTVFGDPAADRPTLAVGPGGNQANSQVVVSWSDNPYPNAGPYPVWAAAGGVNGPQDTPSWGPYKSVPTRNTSDYNRNQSVAVGPDGTIMVCWQSVAQGSSLGGPSIIFIATAPALIPLGFNTYISVAALDIGLDTSLGVPGPLYNDTRGVAAVAELAWDQSNGPYRGRAYVAFMDSSYLGSIVTNVFLRYSTDNGASWPAPSIPVNDDAGYALTTHFLPQLAIDPTSGYLAAAWYDCRNSPDRTKVQVYAGVSRTGGISWTASSLISGGFSDSHVAADPNNFGDYNTMTAYGGNFWPIWADNSGTANPPNNGPEFDMVTIKRAFSIFNAPVRGGASGALENEDRGGTVPSQIGAMGFASVPLLPDGGALVTTQPICSWDDEQADRLFGSPKTFRNDHAWEPEADLPDLWQAPSDAG